MEAGATVESHAGGGATIVAFFSPHAGACQWTIKEASQGWLSGAGCGAIKKALSGLALTRLMPGSRKSPARAGLHEPYARCQKRPSLEPYLLHPWPPASLRIWCHQGSHDPSSHSTSASCPHWGRPKSSKAASGPDSCGWTTCRGGDKTKAEAQGWGD